jgi:hypothetical protein
VFLEFLAIEIRPKLFKEGSSTGTKSHPLRHLHRVRSLMGAAGGSRASSNALARWIRLELLRFDPRYRLLHTPLGMKAQRNGDGRIAFAFDIAEVE